jgi:hypothetical protein
MQRWRCLRRLPMLAEGKVEIRQKSRYVFADCETLIPRTARRNVALFMLPPAVNVFEKGDDNAWTRLNCRNGKDVQRPLISGESYKVHAGANSADQQSR